MRRLAVFFIGITLILAMCITVSADNYASRIQITANVSADESCQVTVIATLHIEENSDSLFFPVPQEAAAVALNGRRVRTHPGQQCQNIDLTDTVGTMTGDFTVTLSYSLPDVIENSQSETPELQLPLLAGYQYPISRLDFTVTMPGEIRVKPGFSSGYHLRGIEEDISYSVNGSTVSGFSIAQLKDHETLTMLMDVDPVQFPHAPISIAKTNVDDIAMIICGVLALLYWLIWLRGIFPIPRRNPSAPEGITAGQVGTILTLGQADLSLTVFSWAQLGYLHIRLDGSRVCLQKQMDMGNERSSFEQLCFKKLFQKKDSVDTASLHYAQLCRWVARLVPPIGSLVKGCSGNSKLFRFLCALIGVFSGVSFAIAITQTAAAQWLWILVFAMLGLIFCWHIQALAGELFLRKSFRSVSGLALSILWLILGLICGQFGLALGILAVQLLSGLLAFHGGRRTDAGKQELTRVLGLRRYLVSKDESAQATTDPDYFHSLAPFALALGVDRKFAQRFGKGYFSECPYIKDRSGKARTAREWSALMSKTLKTMNRRSRLLPLERVMSVFGAAGSFSKRK